jgi:hypothetical protein
VETLLLQSDAKSKHTNTTKVPLRKIPFLQSIHYRHTSIRPFMMASTTAFRPPGLIKTPIEQALYHRAHIANVYTGIADPKEYETVALMTALLYSNIFTTRENFVVSPEQPPPPTSDRRCDIVIRYLESGSENIRALCFAECKRASTSRPFSLKALEDQASEYYKLYLNYEGMPFVYAATRAMVRVLGTNSLRYYT